MHALGAEPFTYSDLESMLVGEQGTESSAPIEALEDLLPKLPMELRRTFTLVYKSQSLQKSTPTHPRVILFNERMILAFNGDPALNGYNSLELMDFKPDEKRIVMREVTFQPGQRPQISEPNPQKCLGCHRSDPRPNWSSYAKWPGVYGSEDDLISKESRELPALLSFRSAAASHPRYRHLLFPKGSESTPYRSSAPGAENYAFRPNLALTQLAYQINVRRVERMLSQSPLYPKWRAYLLSRFLYCLDYEYDPSGDMATNRRVIEGLRSDLEKARIPYTEPELRHSFIPIVELLGVSARDWSMEFDAPARFDEIDGFAKLQDYLAAQLFREVMAENSSLSPYYRIKDDYLPGIENYFPIFAPLKRMRTSLVDATGSLACKMLGPIAAKTALGE